MPDISPQGFLTYVISQDCTSRERDREGKREREREEMIFLHHIIAIGSAGLV